MLRTNIIELNPTKQQGKILKEMLVRSSALWNIGNFQKRQAFFKKEHPFPSYSKQCEVLKTLVLYTSLGSAYSQ